MRWLVTALGVAVACLNLVVTAVAQEDCACSGVDTVAASGAVVSGGVLTAAPASRGGASISTASRTARLPYSYSVVAPQPARIYVEYGAVDQFPFHGRPYGHPGDRWSWYTLSGGAERYLARYYYPPLR